jgi:hypothetical protein
MTAFGRNFSRGVFLSVWLLIHHSVLSGDPEPLLRFIQNKNQWDPKIRFSAQVQSNTINFLHNKLQFVYLENTHYSIDKHNHNEDRASAESGQRSRNLEVLNGHLYNVNFLGANPGVLLKGEDPLKTIYNYFLSDDRTRWASYCKAYYQVRYSDIYCGVDLLAYSQGENFKYEWIISPEVDPSQIRLEYDGVTKMDLEDGNLRIYTSLQEILEFKPIAYQIRNGEKVFVRCNYSLINNLVTYHFPEGYDTCETLVIDPVMIFSAYSGSTQDNWGNTATYDNHGNLYSGGMVTNAGMPTGFPVTPGAFQTQYQGGNWDIGILKYDSSGSALLYATYLGGNNTETPQSLIVNNAGELLVLGATGSNNFPVTNGSTFRGGVAIDPLEGVDYTNGTDIFIAKLSSDGSSLISATYLGGSQNDGVNFISGEMNTASMQQSPLARNYGDQLRGDIIVDGDDNVYIASNTRSADFTAFNTDTVYSYSGGSHDAVVTKLLPDLSSVVWSRFLGGSGTDAAYSIKLDKNRNVYIAGGTNSANMPFTNGLHISQRGGIDGWIAGLSADGKQIKYGTYLGTTAYDQVYFIDIDVSGNIYCLGQTKGPYPVTGGVYRNANAGQFIHKLTAALDSTYFSTTVGSVRAPSNINPNISPTAFLVSECNTLYMSGWGGSINAEQVIRGGQTMIRNYVGGNTSGMPISSDAYQSATTGSDFYFMVLSADASTFLYGTYLGGTTSPIHVDGGTSRFDKQGIVYHAVCAGCGGNSDWPAVNVPPQHQLNRSFNCNNAAFKFDLSQLKARIQTNSIGFDNPGLNVVCIPDKIVFQNKSFGGKTYEWDLGDGTVLPPTTDTTAIVHEYQNLGTYRVKLKIINPETCKGEDSTSILIEVKNTEIEVSDDADICAGTSQKLVAQGGNEYHWRSDDGTFESHQPDPTVTPQDTIQYFVTVKDAFCIRKDTVQINVIEKIDPEFKIVREGDCSAIPMISVVNLTDSLAAGDRLFFDFGDGVQSDLPEVHHQYREDGEYVVRLVGVREFCVSETSVKIPVFSITLPNVITPGEPGFNDTFKVQYGKSDETSPADFGFYTSLIVYNRWGEKVYENKDYRFDWAGDGLAAGIYYYEVTVEDHVSCKSWLHIIK